MSNATRGFYDVMLMLSSRVKEAVKGKDKSLYLEVASQELEKAYKKGEINEFDYLHLEVSDIIRGL